MNKQIYAEAAEWIVELRAGDVDSVMRERLDAWLRISPEHIRAFLELASIWEEASDPALDARNSKEELLALARRSSNLVALDSATPVLAPPVAPSRAKTSSFIRHRALAAAAVLGAIALGAYSYLQRGTYVTDIGEQRSVSLEDGSTLELNSHSRVRVLYSANERSVRLIAGQALFRVARDPGRPFIVQSGSTRVQALGTQFDVYQKPSDTTVTVVEGRVAVSSLPLLRGRSELPASAASGSSVLSADQHPGRPAGSAVVFVSAGEQVTVNSSDNVAQPKRADVAVATAWSQHELIFDSTPLAEVALEFNRYNTRKLVVRDVELRDFHVTGVFSSTDPASLLHFLSAQPGIVVAEAGGAIVISRK